MEPSPDKSNRGMPTPRQTQTYLRTTFQEHGLQPKNKLGQNFLVDLNLIAFIVREADVGEGDLILEVGTGTGSLSAKLSDAARAVLTIEIDASFHDLNQRGMGHRANLTMLRGDVLKNKNRLNPAFLEELARLRERWKPERIKLVANLPYAVATPVVSNLLLSDVPIERMVVTVQWEIAERLTAAPNTKEYSALAVLVQSLADVEILRRLPPAVFWPQPKVESAIVRIRPNAEKRAKVADPGLFRLFLRDLYAHRRKNLRGALLGVARSADKPTIDAVLAQLGVAGSTRAETLGTAEHLRICEALRQRGMLSSAGAAGSGSESEES